MLNVRNRNELTMERMLLDCLIDPWFTHDLRRRNVWNSQFTEFVLPRTGKREHESAFDEFEVSFWLTQARNRSQARLKTQSIKAAATDQAQRGARVETLSAFAFDEWVRSIADASETVLSASAHRHGDRPGDAGAAH